MAPEKNEAESGGSEKPGGITAMRALAAPCAARASRGPPPVAFGTCVVRLRPAKRPVR